jgi:hypothetical protein
VIPTPLLAGTASPRRVKRNDREIPLKDDGRTVTLDPFNRLTTAIGAQGMTRQQMRAAQTAFFLDLIRNQVTALLQQAMPTGQGRSQQRVVANMLCSITPANKFFATAFERAIESIGTAIRDHQTNGPTVILVTCLLAINSIIMATLAAVTCRYRAPSRTQTGPSRRLTWSPRHAAASASPTRRPSCCSPCLTRSHRPRRNAVASASHDYSHTRANTARHQRKRRRTVTRR